MDELQEGARPPVANDYQHEKWKDIALLYVS